MTMDPDHNRFTHAQRVAWEYVVETVRGRQTDARTRVLSVLRSAECSEPMLDEALESVCRHARVVLHFHPDRIGTRPLTVAEAMLEDGQYRSQFETGLSSGSLTAFPGGPRDDWERMLFGGAYHEAGVASAERPKYGALELIRYPDGPWPRFGSCYLVLSEDVLRRTSFTFAGSEQPDAAERLGTIDSLDAVLAPLLIEVASGEGAKVPWPPFAAPSLGVEHLTVPELLQRLSRDLPAPRPVPASGRPGRVLDSGIEAQVHGPIDFEHDVVQLVADPSFIGTRTGACLAELCELYGIALDWHCGFRLNARDVPAEFRGPAIPKLAQRIAGDGYVDAAVVGAAQASLRLRPDEWRDWGAREAIPQQLKQLWHVLVHYGAPGGAEQVRTRG